jgi:hypothetical protein
MEFQNKVAKFTLMVFQNIRRTAITPCQLTYRANKNILVLLRYKYYLFSNLADAFIQTDLQIALARRQYTPLLNINMKMFE